MVRAIWGNRDFHLSGYKFKVMDALITNFHLPESTLLMLTPLLRQGQDTCGYEEAVKSVRFFSFEMRCLYHKRNFNEKTKILAICGPTASGKSALALALAGNSAGKSSPATRCRCTGNGHRNCKANPEEQRRVRHRMIDICEPEEVRAGRRGLKWEAVRAGKVK